MSSDTNLSHLLQIWTTFVNLPTPTLDESVVLLRKTTLLQLNQILQLKAPVYDKRFYENFLIPCLNFEAAILEVDKVNFGFTREPLLKGKAQHSWPLSDGLFCKKEKYIFSDLKVGDLN